jgi:hypothetical protein
MHGRPAVFSACVTRIRRESWTTHGNFCRARLVLTACLVHAEPHVPRQVQEEQEGEDITTQEHRWLLRAGADVRAGARSAAPSRARARRGNIACARGAMCSWLHAQSLRNADAEHAVATTACIGVHVARLPHSLCTSPRLHARAPQHRVRGACRWAPAARARRRCSTCWQVRARTLRASLTSPRACARVHLLVTLACSKYVMRGAVARLISALSIASLRAGRKTQGTIEGEVLFAGTKPTPNFLRRFTGCAAGTLQVSVPCVHAVVRAVTHCLARRMNTPVATVAIRCRARAMVQVRRAV